MDYGGFQAFGSGAAQLLVVASEDSTQVTINPTVDVAGHAAGTPYTVTLNQGEIYRVAVGPGVGAQAISLTGTSVNSDKPVSVFGGTTAAFIPSRVGQADVLIEQLPATSSWGKEFFTVPFATRTGGDTFRFVAANDGTEVVVNNAVVATLDRGQFHEMLIETSARITSNEPIIVGQFANGGAFDGQIGDPSFLVVDPAEQLKNEYSFVTGATGIAQSFVNVTVQQSDLSSLLLDGQPVDANLFTVTATENGATWLGGQLPLEEGAHRLTGDGPFSAVVYGFGEDDSYAYSAGTGLSQIAEVAGLALTPDTITLSPGEDHTVIAAVTDDDGNPVSDVRVDFTVVGANPQDGFVYTDQLGNASFTWTGDNSGSDTVAAVVGTFVATASVLWQTVEPTVTISAPDASGTFRDGQTVVLSGRAIPGAPEAPIASVTVNGTTVDALDASGSWFASVSLPNGTSTFDVVATDIFGNIDTATIILNADIAQPNFENFSRLDSSVTEITYTRTAYNRSTGHLCFEYTLTNTGDNPIQDGAQIAFGEFSPASVSVEATQTGINQLIGQQEYFLQTLDIPAGGLQAGDSTSNEVPDGIVFANPSRQRFDFEAFVVVAGNTAPEFASSPGTIAAADQVYSYDAVATDADNDQLVYSFLSAPAGMTIDSQTGQITWTPGISDVGTHSISIQADDQQGGTASQTFVLTATPATPNNRPPVFVSSPPETINLNQATTPGEIIDLSDWDVVDYEVIRDPGTFPGNWVLVDDNTSANQTVNAEPTILLSDFELSNDFIEGNWRVDTSSDDDLMGFVFGYQDPEHFYLFDWKQRSQEFSGEFASVGMTVKRVSADSPLTFADLWSSDGVPGRVEILYSNDVPWQDFVDYNFQLTFNPGDIQIVISESDSGDELATIDLDDDTYVDGKFGFYNMSQTDVNYTGFTRNELPTRGINYAALAIDPDGDTVTYSLTGGPAGMTIDAQTGQLAWSATRNDLGSQNVSITADDGNGGITIQEFVINVVDQEPSSIEGTVFEDTSGDGIQQAGENGIEGQVVFLDTNTNGQVDANEPVQVTDVDGTFAFTGLLAGSYVVGQVLQTGFDIASPVGGQQSIQVSAGQSLTGIDFANQLNGITGQSVPVITSTPSLSAKVGDAYEYQVRASDADGDTLGFTLLSGPAGAVLDPGTGLLQWTPTADQQQRTSLIILVDDGNGNSANQSFDLLVRPEFEAPFFTTTPNRFTTIDEAFAYDADAVDPEMETILYALVSGPAGATIDPSTGEVQWTPDSAATESFTLSATDPTGQVAFQTFPVEARPTNTAPVFVSDPITEATIGGNYSYTAIAQDAEDSVTYSLVSPVDGVRINSQSGIVTILQVDAAKEFTIRATDDRGLFADQEVSVAVVADTEAPSASIFVDAELTDGTSGVMQPGETASVFITVTDNVAVASFTVTLDGQPIALDNLNRFSYTATTPGAPVIEVIAVDTSGNSSVTQQRIRVIDPTDVTGPVVEINSPAINSQVTYLTDVAITVTADDLFDWNLEYSLKDANNWTELASGIDEVTGDVVATFDPTILRNDLYDIRVSATDTTGNLTTSRIFVGVEGQAKLGNYALEFTDLTVPLAGIPIQITRQYDTLNANESGDFGYGWRLAIGEADIRETIPVTDLEARGISGLFTDVPFFEGTRVYITTPEGQRVGFTFTPEVSGTLLGAQFTPKFTPDVDTDYELEVPFVPLSQNADGTFGLYLFGGNYNPREYTLVSQDQIRYTYDQFDELQTVTDRNDVTLEYRDDGIFSSTGESIQFVRDAQGRIEQIIDPLGNVIEYQYDANGDLIAYSDQEDNTWTHEYSDERAHFLDRIVGPRGNLISEVQYDEDGRFVAIVDAFGNAVEQEYDVENNGFFQTDRNGNTTTLEYDDRGNVTLERDALGNETIYEYADSDNIHLETAITNARGFTTYFTYDEFSNVTLLAEPGRFTRFEYDSFNNVTKTIGPFETLADESAARVTEFKYDENGNLIETIDALGNSSFQTNDQFGRPTSVTDRRGNVTLLEYAQLIGSPTTITNPDLTTQDFTYDSLARPLTQTNELGVVVQTITYDASGRRLSVAGADGQLTTFEYDEDLLLSETVKISDTENQVTSYEYDANNRLFKQADGIGAVVELTYDPVGNVTSLKDPVGNITSYVFDEIDRQIEETDPLGKITTYGYDEVGNLTEKVDRLGRTIEFVYDALDRQASELWYEADGTLIETSSYSYDIFDNLLTASDAESSYAYNYDLLDRLLSSDNAGTPDTPNVILSYTYDVDGNRIRVEDNSGVTIDSEYGSRNQLLSKTWFGGEVDEARIEYGYDDALRETEARRYSDTDRTNQIGSTETAYDDTGRRIRITHLDGSDVVLANYEYEFDNANRITQQVIDDDVVDYTYDATGQLLTADHSDPSIPDEFYVYDLNGNRIDSHLHGSDYVTGPNNQLLSDGEFNYEYDDEGNQIRRTNIASGEATEFEYDHRNRMVRTTVKTSGGIITSESQFVFDVSGRRIAIITDADGASSGIAVRENFVYDGVNVWADYNEAGEAVTRYLFGDDIDSNIARWRAGEGTAWYLTDHLGTVRDITDLSGMLVNQTTYDSFGQVLSETNSLFGDRFKFTGRELNSGSDYYYRTRNYSARAGRFGSFDTIRFAGNDSNLFRYSSNSPSLNTDPTGRVATPEYVAATITFSSFVLGCIVRDQLPGARDSSGGASGVTFGGTAAGVAQEVGEKFVGAGIFGVVAAGLTAITVPASGVIAGVVVGTFATAVPAFGAGLVICKTI